MALPRLKRLTARPKAFPAPILLTLRRRRAMMRPPAAVVKDWPVKLDTCGCQMFGCEATSTCSVSFLGFFSPAVARKKTLPRGNSDSTHSMPRGAARRDGMMGNVTARHRVQAAHGKEGRKMTKLIAWITPPRPFVADSYPSPLAWVEVVERGRKQSLDRGASLTSHRRLFPFPLSCLKHPNAEPPRGPKL